MFLICHNGVRYEVLQFANISLPPKNRRHLAPRLVLELFDHDMIGKNECLGHAVLTLDDDSVMYPPSSAANRPSWRDIHLLNSNQPAGKLLVSVQQIGPLPPWNSPARDEYLAHFPLPGCGMDDNRPFLTRMVPMF